MRAMVMTDRRDDLSGRLLTMRDRAQPEPHGPFDVVVRVAAAGVCRTDPHIPQGELPVSVPHVLGHENSGWVHAVAASPRDRVSLGVDLGKMFVWLVAPPIVRWASRWREGSARPDDPTSCKRRL